MTANTTHIIDRFRINYPHFRDNHVHCNLTKYFEYGKKNFIQTYTTSHCMWVAEHVPQLFNIT